MKVVMDGTVQDLWKTVSVILSLLAETHGVDKLNRCLESAGLGEKVKVTEE